METNDVVKAMAALAQASRLEIFRALVVAGTEGMTPSASRNMSPSRERTPQSASEAGSAVS